MQVRFRKFQEGGEVEPQNTQEQAPQGEQKQQSQDPIAQLAQLAVTAVQNQDCQAAMQVCQGFIALIQQSQQQGGQAPQGEPVYKKGGKLLKRMH